MMKLITSIFFSLVILNFSNAADYYWVGGSGNWSDFANHWATTSGGTSFHTQVPTLNDDVFFDANSFTALGQSVVNDQTIIYCRSMDWSTCTNNPNFAGPNTNELKIFGSLILSPNMTISYSGEIYFESNVSGNVITSSGQVFGQYIYLNGAGGEWSLTDEFNNTSWLNLVSGTLNTNDNNLNVESLYSSATNPMTLNLGASIVTISGSTWAWWINNSSFVLNAGTSLVKLTSITAPDIRYANNLTFYDVEFTDANATAEIISSNNCSFNSITFNGHGVINGNHTINSLNFTAGKNYELASGSTQNVTNWIANGTCTDYISVMSSSVNSQAFINKVGGSINLDFVQLRDIAATGTATFTANNAVDLGNNTGWTIFTTSPRTLYWIGGSGNWSDPSHWSLTSGGSGPECPPNFQDDVFFDINSFNGSGQTVNINVQASCNNMNWTGSTNNPSFDGNNTNDLSIYGSLTFISAMNRVYLGETYFESTTIGNTITMAGQTFDRYIYFNGIGGEWDMMDALESSSWINLVHGTLNTNNQDLTADALYASANNPMTLNLGSSLVTINGSTWAWWINNSLFTLNAGTSLIRLTSTSAPDIRYANNLSFYDVEFTDVNATAEIISSSNNTFNSVTFNGNGIINGSHSMNSMIFSAGKTYELQSTSTQTVVDLVANGNCTEYITIKSTTVGNQANISKASGSMIVEYVQLQDINAVGGATFTANSSVDMGNNTGWTINTSAARNLYWIGGTGNWSDPNHWSLTSGGSGPECPPTFQDNVFFDANSFNGTGQALTLDADGFCKNMDWRGVLFNPSMSGASNIDLSIYGSLWFDAAMSLNFSGNTFFESTAGSESIQSAGQNFQGDIYMNGIGGSWSLLDELTSNSWLRLNHGTVSTNNNNLTVEALYASANQPMTLNLGASIVTITGSTWAWWINNSSFVLNAGTSLIRITSSTAPDIRYANNLTFYDVEFTDANATAELISSNNCVFNSVLFVGDAEIKGSHTFNEFTISPGRTYTFQANSTQTFISAFNAIGTGGFPIEIESTLAGVQANFYMATGTVCAEYLFIGDNNASGGATWTAVNSTDNGNTTGWTFGGCLLSINTYPLYGKVDERKNILTWTSYHENGSVIYTLQKSKNGFQWNDLQSLSIFSDQQEIKSYTIEDESPYIETYYRLKIKTEEDVSISNTIFLNNNSSVSEFIQLYPNPANKILNLTNHTVSDEIQIIIVHQSGQMIKNCKINGQRDYSIDLETMPMGQYYCKVILERQVKIMPFSIVR